MRACLGDPAVQICTPAHSLMRAHKIANFMVNLVFCCHFALVRASEVIVRRRRATDDACDAMALRVSTIRQSNAHTGQLVLAIVEHRWVTACVCVYTLRCSTHLSHQRWRSSVCYKE